jgi:uncharacterized protein
MNTRTEEERRASPRLESGKELPPALTAKYAALRALLAERLAGGLVVAFSGGVDSAFLLWAAEQVRREKGGRLVAVTAVSASLPQHEREEAARFARSLGVEHRWMDSSEVSNPDYARNDALRCYHCKTELFRLCLDLTAEKDLRSVAYGHNASDRGDHRPGHRAAAEAGVASPLDEAGLEKDDIRALLRAFGLPLADKPASPCLSSRLMQGVPVTPAKLRDVEDMESILRRGGLRVFRVRLHEDGEVRYFRIEVAPAEMPAALGLREELVAAAQARGYRWATLDLAGYRLGGASAAPRR